MISVKNNTYQYNKEAVLGRGSFGQVFKCTRMTDKQPFAMKLIEKAKLNEQGDYLIEALEREIATQTIATQSGIPFYVGLYDHFEDDKMIYMIMELCGKNLNKHIEGMKMTEQICLEFVYQVGLGLNYLHSIGITHRDIKTENVLIKGDILKIADFGFATQSKELTTQLGTKPYMSPELFLNNGDDLEYTPKIDVWALNTCLYFLLTKKYFFYAPNPFEMEKQITKKEFIIEGNLAFLSKPTQELLRSGYIKNPLKRPTMKEYISNEAFNGIRAKYDKYMLENKTSSLQDLNFDNLKIENKTPVEDNKNKAYAAYLLNFRNNLMIYSKLAKALQAKQFSRILIFLLVKKHLQYLANIVMFLKDELMIEFGGFMKVDINKQQWSVFVKTAIFLQIRSLFVYDLRVISFGYAQLYKDVLNCNHDGVELPSYDLNIDYKREMVEFSKNINEKILKIISGKSSPELERLSKMIQVVLLYETGDTTRMVLDLNKIEG